MAKNIFYKAKKNFFKYLALPALAVLASCSLNKEFAEDDLYYSPKDDKPRTEISYLDSIKEQVPTDTIEIETIQDLNYAVRNGADANLYWENYFMYSPYSSSGGWDWDGDGIVNAFDLNPWRYDFFDDTNNNGVSDKLEFGYYFSTNLDFIYWDLYWNNHWHNNWRYTTWNYPSWRQPWNPNKVNIWYFENEKESRKSLPYRRRTLSTVVSNQNEIRQNTRIIRNDERNSNIIRKQRTNSRNETKRYERPNTRERSNNDYRPQTRSTRQTRNTYVPNTRTRSTPTTTRESTRTRSSGTTVGSGSSRGSSSSSGTTRSSGSSSRSSNSSSSKRSGGRR